jgi:hypothetical protein
MRTGFGFAGNENGLPPTDVEETAECQETLDST